MFKLHPWTTTTQLELRFWQRQLNDRICGLFNSQVRDRYSSKPESVRNRRMPQLSCQTKWNKKWKTRRSSGLSLVAVTVRLLYSRWMLLTLWRLRIVTALCVPSVATCILSYLCLGSDWYREKKVSQRTRSIPRLLNIPSAKCVAANLSIHLGPTQMEWISMFAVSTQNRPISSSSPSMGNSGRITLHHLLTRAKGECHTSSTPPPPLCIPTWTLTHIIIYSKIIVYEQMSKAKRRIL